MIERALFFSACLVAAVTVSALITVHAIDTMRSAAPGLRSSTYEQMRR